MAASGSMSRIYPRSSPGENTPGPLETFVARIEALDNEFFTCEPRSDIQEKMYAYIMAHRDQFPDQADREKFAQKK